MSDLYSTFQGCLVLRFQLPHEIIKPTRLVALASAFTLLDQPHHPWTSSILDCQESKKRTPLAVISANWEAREFNASTSAIWAVVML